MIHVLSLLLTIFIPTIHVPHTFSIADGPTIPIESATLNGITSQIHVGIPKQTPQAAQDAAMQHFVNGDYTYYNWAPDGAIPMVWSVKSTGNMNALRAAVASGDTRLWLIENEPNVGGQSTSTPQQVSAAARADIDNTSVQWACCGLYINAKSNNWQTWLDAYLAASGPIPDAWHIHLYGDWQTVLQQFFLFYNWQITQNVVRPVIVSEFSAPPDEPYPNGRTELEILQGQLAVMSIMTLLIRYDWVDGAFWFSSYYDLPGVQLYGEGARNLLQTDNDITFTLSPLGQWYLALR